MPIPISYSYRNLLARRLTTFLTAAGMALVVFVFAAVLMLSEGLRRTLVATGSFDNVVVLRAGSESEVQSAIDRTQAGIIGAQPEVALDKEGRRLVADEAIVLINLPKRGSGLPANVIIRGVQASVAGAAPGGAPRRRALLEARVHRDRGRGPDRPALSGGRAGGDPALRHAPVAGGGRHGGGQHRLCLGALGGRGDPAGRLPAHRVFRR